MATDSAFCSKITKSCCFPAFWLLILVLALVFGIFFAIVARDKAGNVVDWRQVNNVTTAGTTPPNANTKSTVSTNNTVKAHTISSPHSSDWSQSTEKSSPISTLAIDNAKHISLKSATKSHNNNRNGHLKLRTFD